MHSIRINAVLVVAIVFFAVQASCLAQVTFPGFVECAQIFRIEATDDWYEIGRYKKLAISRSRMNTKDGDQMHIARQSVHEMTDERGVLSVGFVGFCADGSRWGQRFCWLSCARYQEVK